MTSLFGFIFKPDNRLPGFACTSYVQQYNSNIETSSYLFTVNHFIKNDLWLQTPRILLANVIMSISIKIKIYWKHHNLICYINNRPKLVG